MYEDSLLIVTDTPDKKRVDGVDVNLFKSVIKIDHHPFIEDFGGIESVFLEAFAPDGCLEVSAEALDAIQENVLW